jgi:hypothetical protein
MKGQSYGALVIGVLLFIGLLYIGSNFTGLVSTTYNYTNNITQVLQNITYNCTMNCTANCTGNITGGFPAPNYDSGFVNVSTGETKTLTHNLLGDINNYFVDIEGYDTRNDSIGISNLYFGMMYDAGVQRGFYWKNLTNATIQLYRGTDDARAGALRIRIWTYS